MTAQVMQVQQVISRSRAILVRCMIVQLWRAIVCCDIAKRRQQNRVDSLHCVVVAEAASARFKKLHLQGKIFGSDILALMARLEEGLTGTADDLSDPHTPSSATHLRSRKQAPQAPSQREALVYLWQVRAADL